MFYGHVLTCPFVDMMCSRDVMEKRQREKGSNDRWDVRSSAILACEVEGLPITAVRVEVKE